LSKLSGLQNILSNDLRVFRRRFFRGMKAVSGFVSGEESAAAGGRERRWGMDSLDRFESWRISGIVGGRRPSTYSESPNLWNPYFSRLNVKGVFFAMDLPAESGISPFLDHWLSIPGVLDLTVTDPFKQEVCQSLGSLPLAVTPAEQVERTGSVNHLILDEEGGRVLALNTDGLGMIRALRARVQLAGKRVLLLGAGGTAASIAAELTSFTCTLRIANRTVSRARALAESLHSSASGEIVWSGFEQLEEILPSIDVLISTVSEGCPIGPLQAELLPPNAVLAESKYGTKADLAAFASGRTYVNGRAMLFGQFAAAADVVHCLLGVSSRAHQRALRFVQNRF
jgi:shikimate dehydrogenase